MSEQYFTRPNVQPVITNIGTTPEQRQMSTSEFKAKFDEMPEAIQQYIKETLLTELDAFKEEFMTHQAESAMYAEFRTGGNQSIPHATTTKLILTQETHSADYCELSDGGVKILKSGLYLIVFQVAFSGNAVGYRLVQIEGGTGAVREQPLTSAEQFRTKVTDIAYYEENDNIDFSVSQTSGGALDVIGSNLTRVRIAKLG